MSTAANKSVLPSATGARNEADSLSKDRIVDLRSDAVTLATDSMRQAMANAPVGDDVLQEDPTVNKLEQMAAKLFGMEAALLVPSGTMGNLICVLAHCHKRSAEAVLGDKSHLFMYEQGEPYYQNGVLPHSLPNLPDGTFSIPELNSIVQVRDGHCPTTGVICIENTHNVCGGRVLPLNFIDKVVALGKQYNIPVHCDGARIYNAAVALKQPVARLLQGVSSVSMSLSKGLSAPVGSIIGGTAEFIWLARRLRKALGGEMQQAGVIAAAGIVALEEVAPKLGLDHERAQYLARQIDELRSPFFRCDRANVQTNIIMIELPTERLPPLKFCKRLSWVTEAERQALGQSTGVQLYCMSAQVARMVVHQNISQEDVEHVARKLFFMARELEESEAKVTAPLQYSCAPPNTAVLPLDDDDYYY